MEEESFLMDDSDYLRIKQKILQINPSRYWGDDFDVRFYLISILKKLKNASIIDVAGGIGIICSEIDKSNFRINLDLSFDDLRECKKNIDAELELICASMTSLPFNDNTFDYVINSHVLEIAKNIDIKKNIFSKKNETRVYPTIEKTLQEIVRILKPKGILFLTTPNNAYYNSNKLEYNELKNSLDAYFLKYSISFYNKYSKLSQKYKKLNLANVIPKIFSKVLKREKLLQSLLSKDSTTKKSVSFYVEARKN